MAGIANGDRCRVVKGTHAGKSGTVEDRHVSNSGEVTITVRQDDGVRLKTLARNVAADGGAPVGG
jgi:ribosomal protein S4E